MNLITTTELRTKTNSLVQALLGGYEVGVIHRSKIIGTFKPANTEPPKKFDAEKFIKLVKKMNLPKLSDQEIDKRYREAMIKKHGKIIL